MSKQGLSYEKVAKVADGLKRQGVDPSLTDISKELGILSISSELTEHLEKWYHNQPEFRRKINAPLTENIKLKTENIVEKKLELEKSLSILRATLESTADGIMMVNGEGKVVDWNQKFIDMWRIPSHMMEDGNENISFEYILEQLIDPQSLISDVQYLYQNPTWEGELPELIFKDGRVFERYTQPQRIGKGIVGRVYSFRDVTQKRLAEDELRIRDRAVEASAHGVVIIDVYQPKEPVIYVNRACLKITGHSEKKALGKHIFDLLGRDPEDVDSKRLELAIKEKKEETVEVECIRKNGELYWCEISLAPVKDSIGEIKHFVGLMNDITERREMQDQLIKQATHDFLTELPNRVLLMDRVEQAILQAKKKKTMCAFLFLDLDRFKITNDSLGHGMGDKLLQIVANRLLVTTDDFDTVARIGGDEFVILLSEIPDKSFAEKKAQEILDIVAKPIQLDQHNLKVTASIGISFYPHDGEDYETIMKNADVSMYHAKDSGRNTYRLFEYEMNRQVINTMQLDNALRYAITNDELDLAYQPLIDLKSDKVVGVEALLRWDSESLGKISPVEFIPIAEENGQIIEIGQWVIERACKQIKFWQESGLNDLRVAVNLSSRQFKQGSELVRSIQNVLQKTGLDAKYLELELTETILIEDIQHIVDTMNNLKDLGVRLVIDDFGTGYSSLSYLKQFPVDQLKIDRSFINDMVSDKNDAAITKTIINLGHSLNLDVLAEGIENKFQKNFVKANGCDLAQGYYFKAPQPANGLFKYLAEHSKRKKRR